MLCVFDCLLKKNKVVFFFISCQKKLKILVLAIFPCQKCTVFYYIIFICYIALDIIIKLDSIKSDTVFFFLSSSSYDNLIGLSSNLVIFHWSAFSIYFIYYLWCIYWLHCHKLWPWLITKLNKKNRFFSGAHTLREAWNKLIGHKF